MSGAGMSNPFSMSDAVVCKKKKASDRKRWASYLVFYIMSDFSSRQCMESRGTDAVLWFKQFIRGTKISNKLIYGS
jgi:hypothetical protein